MKEHFSCAMRRASFATMSITFKVLDMITFQAPQMKKPAQGGFSVGDAVLLPDALFGQRSAGAGSR
jgi:hypothetical protein